MRCSSVALLQLLCIACAASLSMAAVPKKAVTGPLFYNPKKIKLSYYPKATFVLPRCGSPMLSNNMDLKVDMDAATKGVAISYNFDPNYSGDGAPFSFDVIDRISLNTKTGQTPLRPCPTASGCGSQRIGREHVINHACTKLCDARTLPSVMLIE
jgi:hypothetical protein